MDEVRQRTGIRLQRLLAQAGVASRRAAEELIQQGRVRVNGRVVTELGAQADAERDTVEVDGRRVQPRGDEVGHEYFLLNKPTGVVSTARDPEGRSTVLDVVRTDTRIYPVGRLDRDTEGLLLLTDDGELTYRLTQARYEVEKEYHALVRCERVADALVQLRRGVELEDGLARAVRADVVREGAHGAWVRVVLHEGRKREVRRMLAAVGCPLERLRRVRMGTLRLTGLRPGEYRPLTQTEIATIRRLVGLVEPLKVRPEAWPDGSGG